MCRISCANPPMTLMTMTSSATPSATPSVEIRVKKGNRRPVGNSCRRARWRYQGTGSGAACRLRLRGAKLREEDDVADALRARQVPDLVREPAHDAHDDDEQRDPERHAERRDQGEEGEPPPGREQLPQGEVEVPGHGFRRRLN